MAHSKTRVVVEQTFGILKQRFPYLRYCLRNNIETVPRIIVAIAILHNICIARNDGHPVGIPGNDEHPADIDEDDIEDGKQVRDIIALNHFS